MSFSAIYRNRNENEHTVDLPLPVAPMTLPAGVRSADVECGGETQNIHD